MYYPASLRQVAFIEKLAAERDISAILAEASKRARTLSGREASAVIESLLASPVRVDAVRRPVEPGYYVHGGQVFVVVKSKSNPDRTYAKSLVISEYGRAAWVYAQGAVTKLADAERLTLEEAKRLGHLHGICVICGAPLTDPESVERGIGPVCAKKLK